MEKMCRFRWLLLKSDRAGETPGCTIFHYINYTQMVALFEGTQKNALPWLELEDCDNFSEAFYVEHVDFGVDFRDVDPDGVVRLKYMLDEPRYRVDEPCYRVPKLTCVITLPK